MKQFPQVFVDLDGVLADFDSGYEAVTGSRPDKASDNVDWAKVRAVPGFYAGLPLMPDAMHLWGFLSSLPKAPIVLTGYPKRVPEAVDDKVAWVARMLGPEAKVVCCLSAEKASYAEPGDVLVDDWEKYREKWLAAGGVWVTHKSAAESVRALSTILP